MTFKLYVFAVKVIGYTMLVGGILLWVFDPLGVE